MVEYVRDILISQSVVDGDCDEAVECACDIGDGPFCPIPREDPHEAEAVFFFRFAGQALIDDAAGHL